MTPNSGSVRPEKFHPYVVFVFVFLFLYLYLRLYLHSHLHWTQSSTVASNEGQLVS